MATVEKFEGLFCWKRSRELVREIYKEISKNLKFQKDYGLRDQIQCASVSITSNIAEGFEPGTKREFFKLFVYCQRFSKRDKSAIRCRI